MKGLYITNLNPHKSPGYDTKILGQIKGLGKHNIEMTIIYFSLNQELIIGHQDLKMQSFVINNMILCKSQNIFSRRFQLLQESFKQLQQSHYDFIYFRYPRSEPLFIAFLALIHYLFPKIRILHEIPTFPYDQENSQGISLSLKAMVFLDKITRPLLKKYVDRVVVISYQGKVFGIPSITIHNGIDTESISLINNHLEKARKINHLIEIVGIGNIEFWHGYDRVIYGLANYLQQQSTSLQIIIHLISPNTQELLKIKELVQTLSLNSNVIFHGSQSGERLEKIMKKSSIALGDLGSHRKGIKETSALKIRNYISRGIPYISSGIDSDVPENFPYFLKVPFDDSPLDFLQIIKFVQTIYQDLQFPEKMREFANQKLDWSVQMQPVINYLKTNIKE